MRLSDKQIGNILMFIVIAIFATNIPISKYILTGHISAIGLTGLRILFGAFMFWIASLFTNKDVVSKKDHATLFLAGLTGIIFNQGLFIVGLSYTSPVDASIITTSSPLFAMIFAALIIKEPITLQKAGGVVVGVIGAIILIYTGQSMHTSGQNSNWIGNMIVVGSSLSYAFYLVVSRSLSAKYSAITIMKWMFTYAAIIFTPFAYKDITTAPLFFEIDHTALISLIYPLLFATFIAYAMIPMAQKRIRPTTISMYNNFQPVIASIIAISVGMDKFTIEKLFAAILVFIGVYLVTQSKSKKDLEKEQVTEKQ